MSAALLPRFWPPQHWAARQRLRNPDEALWSELRIARGEIDVVDLMVRAIGHCEDALPNRGATFRHFDQLLERWASRGMIAVTGHPPRYRLEKDYLALRSPPPPAAPRRNPFPKRTQRQRLWSAMKVLRNFDLPTLLMTAEASRPAAMDMIRVLERGGWLRVTQTGWTTAATRQWGAVAPTYSHKVGPNGPFIRVTEPASGAIIDLPIRPKCPRDQRRESSADGFVDGGVS